MSDEPLRVDTWLWAARFFKTRSQAAEAVTGGHVDVNGQRAKPSKAVRPGDELEIVRGQIRFVVVVCATNRRRGPATDAALLYEERADSVAARERAAQQRRLEPPMPTPGGRPTKRDRRRLDSARDRRGR